MRLKKVTLNNYRCFRNLEVELHPRLTVLVGENGAGKTAILDGIAAGLSPILKYLSSANQRLLAKGVGIKDTDFRLEKWEKAGGKENWISSDYAQVILETTDGVSWDYWRPSTAGKGKKPSTSIGEVELASYLAKISDSFKTPKPELLPVFSYYGAGAQRGYIEGPERLRLPNENYAHPTSALIKALDSSRDFKELLNWFYIEESDELRANKGWEPEDYSQSIVLEAVRFAVLVLLDGAYKNPHFNSNRKFIVESSDTGVFLQVPQLSQGYQRMLALGMDFARRLALANSHLTHESDRLAGGLLINNLFQKLLSDAVERGWKVPSENENFPPEQLFAPSIMLVDEIDLHLHPSWQQRVLGDLMRAFPGTQFIVTTHSPQVLSTVPAESIRILHNGADPWIETPSQQTRGDSSANVLAATMKVDPVPKVEESAWLSEYRALIQQGLQDSAEGMELRSKLIAHFGERHPEMLECERLIRLEAFKRRLPPLGKSAPAKS